MVQSILVYNGVFGGYDIAETLLWFVIRESDMIVHFRNDTIKIKPCAMSGLSDAVGYIISFDNIPCSKP